jgi:hypothetical protein
VFKAFSDSGKVATTRDVIADFTHGDRIDLSAMDANSHSSGNQRFSPTRLPTSPCRCIPSLRTCAAMISSSKARSRK